MNIQTKYHGVFQLNKEDILYFDKGIPGFPEETKFVILSLTDDGGFGALQSINTPELAFVIKNPFDFNKSYDFILEDYVVDALEISNQQDVMVYSILTVQEPFDKTTANLQAPIIINNKNHKAMQVILNDQNYSIRHPIFLANPNSKEKG
ncbi:flagellar assembly protein FliW [Niallia sp. MER 6]|uniref:flagellar assembly protein FliW n=1 Tax=Niallia sp. MER 6 TaxID=2939567 RepID=UPI00203BE013|nr:flagellar assembly protein FliW [Niallia sp. MER 6]MCM3029682.1 flagellar assembly protein FliW [Niallia sp. MER 6]